MIKDIDIFGNMELYITNNHGNGDTEAFYSKEECLKHNERCFGMKVKDLDLDRIKIVDANIFRVNKKIDIQAKNKDVALAVYYKMFKEETRLSYKGYCFEIEVTSCGYDILIFKDMHVPFEPEYIVNFERFDINQALIDAYNYVNKREKIL